MQDLSDLANLVLSRMESPMYSCIKLIDTSDLILFYPPKDYSKYSLSYTLIKNKSYNNCEKAMWKMDETAILRYIKTIEADQHVLRYTYGSPTHFAVLCTVDSESMIIANRIRISDTAEGLLTILRNCMPIWKEKDRLNMAKIYDVLEKNGDGMTEVD